MHHDDSQVLAVLNDEAKRDKKTGDDLRKAIASRDKDLFAQVVARALRKLNRTVSDFKRFVDTAYIWFKTQM
jgi:hypothetical protein